MTKARAGRWVKHASTFAKQNPFVTRHARSTLVRRSAVHRPQAVDRCKFSCPILPLSAPRRQCSCPTDVLRTTTLTARKEKGFATLFHAPRAEGGACMALLLRTITGTLAPRKTSGCGQHLGSQPFSSRSALLAARVSARRCVHAVLGSRKMPVLPGHYARWRLSRAR